MKFLKRGLAVFLAALLMMPSMTSPSIVYASAPDVVQEKTADDSLQSDEEDKGINGALSDSDGEIKGDSADSVEGAEEGKDSADVEDAKEEEDSEDNDADAEEKEDSEDNDVDAEDKEDFEDDVEDAEDEDALDADEETEEAGEDEETAEFEITDEIFYNTGNHAWQIVNEEAFTKGEIGDGYFEEDGSYTIHIPEENPFFPYEVQFTYDDEVMNLWFMSPDDSVEIGGHIFYVSADFDGTMMTQMSLQVARDTIIIYPEEKEFTDDGDGAVSYSLQPLEEVYLGYIDLRKYTPVELTMVRVDAIFGNNQAQRADSVVWKYRFDDDDNYTISPVDGGLDLSDRTYYGDYSYWEMIVGTADQLDRNNRRYIATLRTTSSRNWLTSKTYLKKNDGSRTEIDVTSSSYYVSDSSNRYQYIYASASQINSDAEFYVTLDVNDGIFPEKQYDSFEIYEGQYATAGEAASGTKITEQIIGTSAGYLIQPNQNPWITMVTYKDGSVTGCLTFYLNLEINFKKYSIGYVNLYKDGDSLDYAQQIYSKQTTSDGCINFTSTLYAEYAADSEYYLNMNFYPNKNVVTAAYEGRYDSIAAAKDAKKEDIKDSLFNYSGKTYAADFSKGVYITVFVGKDGEGQEVYQCFIKAETGTTSKDWIESISLYSDENRKDSAQWTYSTQTTGGCINYTSTLYAEYAADRKYYLGMSSLSMNKNAITAVYEGQYSSIAEAQAKNKENIKDSLFNYSGKTYAADFSKGVYITVFVGEDGEDQISNQYFIKTEAGTTYKYKLGNIKLYQWHEDGKEEYVQQTFITNSTTDGCVNYTSTLYSEFAAKGEYYLSMDFSPTNSNDVTAAYEGKYDSIAKAKAAKAEDIKDSLFNSDNSKRTYKKDFSQGVYITVFVGEDGKDQKIYQCFIKTETGKIPKYILSISTKVKFVDLLDSNKKSVAKYAVSYSDDSYGENNYATILVNADTKLDKLIPVFESDRGIHLYTADDNALQVSGVNPHDFSKGAVHYTASAENQEDSKNYWLQVVPINSGKRLYVNSLDDDNAHTYTENDTIYSTREVLLDKYHNGSDWHDILFINAGTEDIENLEVELVSDTLELDEYWTLNGNHKLSAVTTVDKEEGIEYGELANLAKVRLKKKGDIFDGADVTGTLTVKSGDEVLMVLTLTGTVGEPCITTEELPKTVVQYVPYGAMIQNNNKYSWNKPSYSLESGELPEGMEVKPNGEVYGVPKESGEFEFTVRMKSSRDFPDSLKTYTMTVLENTDENVDNATDDGYTLEERILGEEISEGDSQTLVSEGEYGEFVDIYLDGDKLIAGTDYTSEAGSTRITIQNQTLNKEIGTHTLGIEFRTQDEDNTLMRAAQNYKIEEPKSPDEGNDDPNGDNNGPDDGNQGSGGDNNGPDDGNQGSGGDNSGSDNGGSGTGSTSGGSNSGGSGTGNNSTANSGTSNNSVNNNNAASRFEAMEQVVNVSDSAYKEDYKLAQIDLSYIQLLKASLMNKYRGQKMYMNAALGAYFGLTIDMAEIPEMKKDYKISYSVLPGPVLSPEFDAIHCIPDAMYSIEFNALFNFHIGSTYIGHDVYIFQLNEAGTRYELVSEMTANEIGNIAFVSNKVADIMILVKK